MNYTAPRHLESLQVLRGIAASLVVMVHAINVIDLAPMGWHRGWLNSAASLNEFGATGVDLFFVISGFVMAFTMGRFNGLSGARRFAARRFWRVVPPFWFACLLFIPFSRMIVDRLPLASYVNAVTFVPVWHSHPYSPPPLAIGWTLAFELVFYAMVSTVIASRVTTGQRACVLAIVMTCAGVGSLFPRSIIFNPMMAEFGLGIVVYMAWRRGISRFFHWTALSTGSAALLASAIFGWIFDARLEMAVAGAGGDMRVICWGVPWALVVLGAADVAISRKVVGRAFVLLGDASYSVYLSHMFIMAPIMALSATSNQQWCAPDLLIFAIFLAAVMLGLLVYRTMEMPYLAWTTRRVQRVTECQPRASLSY